MNMHLKKIFPLLIIFALAQNPAYASPWAKKEGYWNKTGGKFVFGLKHSLFSWMTFWTETREPGYNKAWEGFSTGLGKTVVYTVGGLVQLATFPIPADFPDFGIGMHIPSKECPARHAKDYVKPAKNPLSKKAADQTNKKTALKTELKPLTTPSTFSEQPSPVVVEVKKTVTAPLTVPVEAAAAPVITEVKKSEPAADVIPAVEKTEQEKAQEAELEAQAAAAFSQQNAAQAPQKEASSELSIDSEPENVPNLEEKIEPAAEKSIPIKTVKLPEQKSEDKAPESNDDILSVNPQTPKQGDNEDDLWDDEDGQSNTADDNAADSENDTKSDENGGLENSPASAVKSTVSKL